MCLRSCLQLRGTEHEGTLRLLELFAYGTYNDAAKLKDKDQALSRMRPAMTEKLRMLSMVTLAQTHRVIPYSLLLTTLEVNSHTCEPDDCLRSLRTHGDNLDLSRRRYNPGRCVVPQYKLR